MAYLLCLSINLVFFFVNRLDPAPGPIKNTEFFSLIINFFNKFILFTSYFKTEGNFKEYIGNVFLEHIILTDPVPTLNAASELKIVEPIIFS